MVPLKPHKCTSQPLLPPLQFTLLFQKLSTFLPRSRKQFVDPLFPGNIGFSTESTEILNISMFTAEIIDIAKIHDLICSRIAHLSGYNAQLINLNSVLAVLLILHSSRFEFGYSRVPVVPKPLLVKIDYDVQTTCKKLWCPALVELESKNPSEEVTINFLLKTHVEPGLETRQNGKKSIVINLLNF